jgi:hypothetical protein
VWLGWGRNFLQIPPLVSSRLDRLERLTEGRKKRKTQIRVFEEEIS